MTLGADLERAWRSQSVTLETSKRIVRTLIDEIVVRVEDKALGLVIRWQRGDHSSLKLKKNRKGQHRWSAEAETIDLVRALARQSAGKGNCVGAQSGRQDDGPRERLAQSQVCSSRSHNEIATASYPMGSSKSLRFVLAERQPHKRCRAPVAGQ